MRAMLVMWLLCSLASMAQAQPRYEVTDIGSLLPDVNSKGVAISERGHVVGFTSDEHGFGQAFVYSSEMGVEVIPSEFRALAVDVNSSGDMLVTTSESYSPETDMFLWKNGVLRLVGSDFYDVGPNPNLNDRGQIAGYAISAGSLHRAGFILDSVSGNDIHLEVGGSEDTILHDINENGLVVGSYLQPAQTAGPRYAGFLYDTATGQLRVLGDYGSGSTESLHAYALNNLGHVVAQAGALSTTAYFWDGEHPAVEIANGCCDRIYVRDLNDADVAVGENYSWGGGQYAFLWKEGKMENLNDHVPDDAGIWLQEAWAINNRGQIVGTGRTDSGDIHAYVLNPVPEPSGPVLLLTAFCAIIGYLRLRTPRWTTSR